MKLMLLAAPSDIHCIRWANAMQARDNVNVVICYMPNHKPRLEELNEGIKLVALKYNSPRGYYLNRFELSNIIKNESPDIINVHYASGYGYLGRLSIPSDVPSLLSVYGADIYDFPYRNFIAHKIMENNLKFYDEVASTSNSMAKQINKVCPDIKLKDIFITPFGVDQKQFSFRKSNKSNRSKIIVGSVKKLAPKYGIETGILAIEYLVKEKYLTGIEYHIYGEGPQKDYLEELVIAKGIEDNVIFFDRVNNKEVPNVLKTFDIFIAPSTLDSESFGVSVVEAMSVGVTVIASDVDGFKEVLNDGECGFIFKRNDYLTLANYIEQNIKSPLSSEKVILSAKDRVESLYSWDENVEYMNKIYLKCMEKK